MTTNHTFDDLSRDYLYGRNAREMTFPQKFDKTFTIFHLLRAHFYCLSGKSKPFMAFWIAGSYTYLRITIYIWKESTENAQQSAYYTFKPKKVIVIGGPLFSFPSRCKLHWMHTSFYMLDDSTSSSKLSRSEFIRHIATSLLHNPIRQ